MAVDAPTTTRPGGRSARVRASVHRAVEEMLADGAVDLTIPHVAARAGVHPTTVYRRWGSIGELLAAVAASRFSGDIVVPDTGSLRGDLEQWITDVAVDVSDPDTQALIRATIGATERCEVCVTDRQDQLVAILDRERERGGEAPDPERARDALLGPVYYRALFLGDPGDPGWARTLVGALLD